MTCIAPLRQWGADNGKRILLFEAGEALRFDPLAIRSGVRGVLNVLHYLGLTRRPPSKKPKSQDVVVAKSSLWVRAPQSGLGRVSVKLGSRVEQGDQIASIADTMGEHETPVASPYTGIVIGCTNMPIVNEGDALIHLARFSDSAKVEQVIEAFQEEHLEGLGPGDYQENPSADYGEIVVN